MAEDLTAQLEYVANPAYERYQGNNANASSIIDLQVYHDRLFSGYGNWNNNLGPVTMAPVELVAPEFAADTPQKCRLKN